MDVTNYPGFIDSLVTFEQDYPRETKIIDNGDGSKTMRFKAPASVWGLDEPIVQAEMTLCKEKFSQDRRSAENSVMIRLGSLSVTERIKKLPNLSDSAFCGLIQDIRFLQEHPDLFAFLSVAEVNAMAEVVRDSLPKINGPRADELGALKVTFAVTAPEYSNPYEEALENHAASLRFARETLQYSKRGDAMQPFVVKALSAAKTYCWSADTVEAVATGARKLEPATTTVNTEDLGLLGRPGEAGFYWFTRGIPIQTTMESAEKEPVSALLWMRDESLPLTYFSLFTRAFYPKRGKISLLASPSISWTWIDGESLELLQEKATKAYHRLKSEGMHGSFVAPIENTLAAEQWFSKFWLVSAEWLQQRITVVESGHVERHARKRAEKAADRKFSAVSVISLRRRATKPQDQEHDPDSSMEQRIHTRYHKWWVDTFPRNQWYPALKVHKRIWVEGHMRGPDDKPMLEKARVYAVTR